MAAVASGGLKRRLEEAELGSQGSRSDDEEVSNSDSGDSCDSVPRCGAAACSPPSILKRQKRLGRKSVRFDQVTVYYFSRRQGFTSVPSQGGSSLGMAPRHSSVRSYTLCEFAREQQGHHRQLLRQHLRQEKLRARKMKLTRNGTVASQEAEGLTLEDVSDDDIDVEGVEVDDCFFLQPLPTKRRRALLRAAGVQRIDAEEKQELRAIRLSREECGCHCRLYCDPQACACSQAGIKCQVDRMSFPCGCSRDGCGNASGRIEFNPLRVRTHYLHTIMKLELESKRQGGRPPAPEQEAAALPPGGAWPGPQAAETQDFQEFMAENESAVLHLQSAEELERLKAEEDSSSGSGVEGLGVCILQEPLAVPEGLCPALAAPILIQAQLPPGSSVLCFAEGSEPPAPPGGSDPYLNDGAVLYYQLEPRPAPPAKAEGSPAEPPGPCPCPVVPQAPCPCPAEPPAPCPCPPEKGPGALPVPCSRAASEGEAPRPPPSAPEKVAAAAPRSPSQPAEPAPEPPCPEGHSPGPILPV
ncbi:cysteine/serine-rich nuclear protein 2 [Dryobates pubescens]|uniref:cysteine/serine-rich nuclear protein 2 n=1 Tax=Dryobates pubescens TaxID=118200 RepID=UPI0023B923D0|nr:cysteine/serine-rich nuclear protein 2 [Dryobates pubescens]